MQDQLTKSLQFVRQATPTAHTSPDKVAIFDESGAPVPFPPIAGLITVAGAIGTAAKTTAQAEPQSGTLVPIKFTSGNSAASPTVAFAGGAARAVYLAGAAPASGEVTIAANGIGLFYFDGTILHQVGALS